MGSRFVKLYYRKEVLRLLSKCELLNCASPLYNLIIHHLREGLSLVFNQKLQLSFKIKLLSGLTVILQDERLFLTFKQQ